MITRKIDRNDERAGFVYSWVEKLSGHLDELRVITWQESDGAGLPGNVKVFDLSGNKFFKIIRFERLVWQNIKKADGLFCHMNPEYTILSAPIAKLFRKKVVSWYVHKQVSWRLHLVNLLADVILTASDKSCRLKDRRKIKVVGHGINTDVFRPGRRENKFVILSIGRISPIKNYEVLIEAIGIMVSEGKANLEVRILGGPGLKSQEEYFNNLEQSIKDKGLEKYVKLLGAVPHSRVLPYYQGSSLFVNLSGTGSIDKAVLEAMACGIVVLTSNEAFKGILNDDLVIENNPGVLAEKIRWAMNLGEKAESIGEKLRSEVVENYNLDKLVVKIINQFKV